MFIPLLQLLVTKAFSQSRLPSVYEIKKTDSALIVTLPDSYCQVLEVKNSKLTFDQLRHGPVVNNF